MKHIFIIIAFFLCCTIVQAQVSSDYAFADRVAYSIPKNQTQSSEEIASYINEHCKTDQEKIRAAYTWVTSNITYDIDSMHFIILDEDNDKRIARTLKSRRGVCENFASLFTDICVRMGINAFTIEGYTRQNGAIDRTQHVWCAAYINNKWFMYDPTWDVGTLRNQSFFSSITTNYFQKLPSEFIYNHFPFDPLFQLLNYPVKYRDFERGRNASEHSAPYFNYEDSLKVYQSKDSLDRYLSSLTRIKNTDWPTKKSETKIKRIQLEIELIYQDHDMTLYNSAIADYNNAIASLNEFIVYRNHQFAPAKKSEEVESLFTSITNKIFTANQKLKKVNSSHAVLNLDTGDIQKKLDDLEINAKDQKEFYKNHLSAKKIKEENN